MTLTNARTAIHDGSAVVTRKVAFRVEGMEKPAAASVKTRLTKVGGNWLILADATKLLNDKTLDLVNVVAVTLANPAVYGRHRSENLCLAHIDMICVATLHNNGEFVVTPENYAQTVTPYAYGNNKNLFTCPADTAAKTSYLFNCELKGRNLATLDDHDEIVMIYEGKDEN